MLLEKDVESFFLEFVMFVYLSFVLIEETWKAVFLVSSLVKILKLVV